MRNCTLFLQQQMPKSSPAPLMSLSHTHSKTLSGSTAHAYELILSQLNTSAFKPFVSCVTDNSSRSSFIALNLFVSCSRAVELEQTSRARFRDLSQATQCLRIYTHKFGQSVFQSENTQSFSKNNPKFEGNRFRGCYIG